MLLEMWVCAALTKDVVASGPISGAVQRLPAHITPLKQLFFFHLNYRRSSSLQDQVEERGERLSDMSYFRFMVKHWDIRTNGQAGASEIRLGFPMKRIKADESNGIRQTERWQGRSNPASNKVCVLNSSNKWKKVKLDEQGSFKWLRSCSTSSFLCGQRHENGWQLKPNIWGLGI